MRKKIFILGLMALAVTVWAAPSFAARAIQGTVGEVSSADAAALGSVGFRIWSGLAGGESNINDNVASCRNVRCIKTYVTNATLNPGGYVGNQEATQVYNGDLPDQPYYELVDASMNDAAGNHIGYFGVSGVTANNAGIGNFLAAGCAGTTATNCFGRIDTSVAGATLSSTNAGYGGAPHTIRPIGGLNPIPVPLVTVGGGCPAGMACLTWSDPPTFGSAMRPSTSAGAPASPVKGLHLYKVSSPTCTDPTGADAWAPVGTFDLGQNSTQVPLPVGLTGCDYYAFTVRLLGPGGDPNEVETFRVGAHSQGVGTTPTAVRIVRFNAQYAGHGIVNVNWQTGLEGDVSGFYLTRSVSANGPFARVSDLIRAKGIDSSTYTTSDRVPAGNGRVYYYQLDVVGRDGSVTTSSPAAVTLPSRGKKSGPAIR